jgi:hypothetical protein
MQKERMKVGESEAISGHGSVEDAAGMKIACNGLQEGNIASTDGEAL